MKNKKYLKLAYNKLFNVRVRNIISHTEFAILFKRMVKDFGGIIHDNNFDDFFTKLKKEFSKLLLEKIEEREVFGDCKDDTIKVAIDYPFCELIIDCVSDKRDFFTILFPYMSITNVGDVFRRHSKKSGEYVIVDMKKVRFQIKEDFKRVVKEIYGS